jgi:AraC-like DNA-binding protein
MQSVDPGVLPNSSCFSFTPSETANRLYYYPIWIGHYFCNADYFMKRDYFPYLLLVYIRKGEFFVEYRDRRYTARKGDVVLIDCQEPHFYQAANGLEFLYIHFDGVNAHALCQYMMSQYGILFQGDNTPSIGKLLLQMIEQNEHNQAMTASDSSLLIYQMLILLTQRPDSATKEVSPIDLAIQYIRGNVGQKISLQELAQRANLSVYYFSHIFKSQTGYSPLEYVISTRLDTAKVLLKTTTLTVAEIADRVGYSNSGSFTNLFVQKMGCSPKAFRQAPI